MGGSSPKPYEKSSAEIANETRQVDLMAQQLAEQKRVQEEAKKAQEQMIYNTQMQAAQQAGQVGSQNAMQELQKMNQYQTAKDDSIKQLAYQQAMSGANAATGGGGIFDLVAARQQQAENLGSASAYLPKTQANLQENPVNPVTTNLLNKVASASGSIQPQTTFGGN